ncbi:hypothetical protein MtrunA17_Chr6g0488221 [Medicago truncatula]|uniref:Gamete-like protein n=1 Tax=Medicago truncatula TaxID=3880 RepID=A0A396HIJ1_MEDTR|nr:hypothetical protein MtrunA17_Chr6g0488221 [Medicago truncatula]
MGLRVHLLVLILVSFSLRCESWGWYSSNKESHSNDRSYGNQGTFRGSSAEFSIEAFNDPKGMKLIENAKNKMVGSNTCWQNAYQHLFAGCSEILSADEKRSRLAWHLSDCFQRDSGRVSFPHCDTKTSIVTCLRNLDDLAHKVYLEFYLETNSICYQLQLITQLVAQTVKNVETHIDVVLRHSKSVYEQTTKIAASQSQLEEGQEDMKRKLEDGVALLKESYSYLGKEIEKLRDEAIEIENEVIKVGNTMSSKMNTLQTKAEDIGNMAGVSLEKQQELLDGQSTALKGLNSLNEVQFKALEESRKSVQYFSEYGHKQQEELLQRQEQMQGLHDRLMENSKTVLSAQETFEAKQATMFVALDKIFALQNAMLLESRVIKAFFIYAISIFVIFMLTSTKQTYNVRPLLYIELCVALFVEVFIIRLTNDDIEQQTWIINKVRLFLMVAASAQLTYAIVTYRDYERLNHQMLLTLLNKINNMEKLKDSNWDFDTTDYVDWSQLIGTDLPDDVNCLDDPDFVIPEEVAENSITISTTKNYNLRSRNRLH